MKRSVRLTEKELKKMISESVKRVLNERFEDDFNTARDKHIGRGGGYNTGGDTYPISSRATSEEDSPNLAISFRVVMYLK